MLFLTPVDRRLARFALDWETAVGLPWGVLLLFGGGLSLAAAMSVQTSFVVFRIMQSGASEIFCTGKYLDQLVDLNGGLKFRERIVVCDSERIDTMIVIPL